MAIPPNLPPIFDLPPFFAPSYRLSHHPRYNNLPRFWLQYPYFDLEINHAYLVSFIPACAGETLPQADKRSISACAGETDQNPPPVCGGNPACAGTTLMCPAELRADPRVCGGNPVQMIQEMGHQQADPRVCGGNADMIRNGYPSEGRSPRVRGKRLDNRIGGTGLGPIPACAGETTIKTIFLHTERADPRVCGGNPGCWSSRSRWPGRPIPACAGETLNLCYLHIAASGRGRSPRVRGKPKIGSCASRGM